MKKLFGLDKQKPHPHHPQQHQIYQLPNAASSAHHQQSASQHNFHPSSPKRSHSHDRWSLISNQDLRSTSQASIPLVDPRSASPFPDSTIGSKPKKQPMAALGILSALDPHAVQHDSQEDSPPSQHVTPPATDKKEKKGFWERAGVVNTASTNHKSSKDKDGRGRDKDKKGDEELTRMIGYLTATASEDWTLVMEVCDRASASESAAKEAVRAIRREFRYGEPPAQLAAARLWAIMLRNSSEIFVSQSTSRKFLDTVEDLLSSSRTSPVVRERLLDVLAAASYASENRNEGTEGFRGLWKKVKPNNRPDAGVPFDNEDTMFVPVQQLSNSQPGTPTLRHKDEPVVPPEERSKKPRKRKSLTKNRIIPFDEDVRRLMQECTIGSGNAQLLLEALRYAKPSELRKKNIIQEFLVKCRYSQELICTTIPWASSCAEQSRLAKDREQAVPDDARGGETYGENPEFVSTKEEDLLAALLKANEELHEALRVYEELEQLSMERKAKERSKREVRLDRTNTTDSLESTDRPAASRAPSQTSSPASTPPPSSPSTPEAPPQPTSTVIPQEPPPLEPPHHQEAQYLPSTQPPMDIPRSLRPHSFDSRLAPHALPSIPPTQRQSFDSDRPLSNQSFINDLKTSSLESSVRDDSTSALRHVPTSLQPRSHASTTDTSSLQEMGTGTSAVSSTDYLMQGAPSAKALGKRRDVDSGSTQDPSYLLSVNGHGHRDYHGSEGVRPVDEYDDEQDIDSSLRPLRHRSIHYVYDAAAERARQFMQGERIGSTVH